MVIEYEAFKADMINMLIDKTEGEARGNIKSIEDLEDGVEAYRVMHDWFTRVSGLGLAERRSRFMIPTPANNEGQIVKVI